MTTWKACEREIATRLGGTRVPVSGRARGDAPDIAHPDYSIEVKHRKSLPAWLHDAFAQAKASKTGNQLPIVILHEEGQRYDNCYVMVRLKNLDEFIGTTLATGQTEPTEQGEIE